MRNWVFNPKFTPNNVRVKVEEQLEYFRKRKVTLFWWNGPSAQPSNLGEIMEQEGLVKINLPPESGDMILYLDQFEDMEERLRNIIKKTGISIQKVRTYAQIREAVDLVIQTNNLPENFRTPGEKSCEVMLHEEPDRNILVGYIAYIENRPVAVSSVLYGGGVAGIYNVGTLKKFRHRGIGRAITLAPLIDAKRRRFEIAVLTATTQGYPIYKKIGFRKLHVFNQYFWLPQRLKRFFYKLFFRWRLRMKRN
jgi:ribosomal protein S18 acetylase RimI-like enzyme